MLFCRCPLAVALWQTMADQWRIPDVASFRRTGSEWLAQALCDLPDMERMELMMTLWRCWFVRNELVHHKKPPPIEVSKRFLTSYVDSLVGIQNNPEASLTKGKHVVDTIVPKRIVQREVQAPPVPLHWSRPATGWTKLNIDGSFSATGGEAGAGMIVHSETGDIIFSSCRELRMCSEPLEAELHACMEGSI